jgi:N-acetylglucosamine-6-sulfatase
MGAFQSVSLPDLLSRSPQAATPSPLTPSVAVDAGTTLLPKSQAMKFTRRKLLATPLAAACGGLAAQAPKGAPPRPNILFVLVDDLRWDELGCTGHPFAETPHADRLAREGALFPNAFATTPLCSPSRACFLTGRYAHSHGITDNTNRSADSHRLITWPRLLRDAGYETGFVGKWHMGNDDSPRPGFDSWVSFPGQGECIDPVLNVQGKETKSRGYITDLLADYGVQFLDRKRSKPFCLYVAHKAIHPNVQQRDDGSVAGSLTGAEAFIPAERHRQLYAGNEPPRRANYGRPPTGKPALERPIDDLPPLGPQTVTSDQTIRNRMRMMKAVDESLGRMIEAIENAGQLENTVIVLTSDHGYFYGEHGLDAERRLAYEETIRIPLLIRAPAGGFDATGKGRIQQGRRLDAFALSIDIAPTMLELAGVERPANLQGRSLLPLLQNASTGWREDFLIEYFSDTVFPRIRNMGYQAVRTGLWKYIQYQELKGMDELYDLSADPYELNNLIASGPVADMRRRLERLRQESAS